MSEEVFEFPLDEELKHFVRVVKRFEKGLESFVVVYYVLEGEKRVPLVTFDLCHGFPHRDLRFLPAGEKRRKKLLEGKRLEALVEEALDDVYRNWRKYFDEYVRGRE